MVDVNKFQCTHYTAMFDLYTLSICAHCTITIIMYLLDVA